MAGRHWRFAKTMPQWPHEYTVRKYEDPAEAQALFEEAVAFIRANGERRTFEPTGKSSLYFDIDGRQYWTMGASRGNNPVRGNAFDTDAVISVARQRGTSTNSSPLLEHF